MSDKLYAKIGKQQERIEELEAVYQATLREFAAVLSGEISGDRILINLSDNSFARAEEGQVQVAPEVVDGFPKIVIGQDDRRIIRELQGELAEFKAKELMQRIKEERAAKGEENSDVSSGDNNRDGQP